MLRVALTEPGRDHKWAPMEFKVFGAGQSDWQGLILGARALDAMSKGGLGLRVTETQYAFEAEGTALPPLGEDMMPRRDSLYAILKPTAGEIQGFPAVAAARGNRSAFDSDDEDGPEAGRGCTAGAIMSS